MLWFGLILDIRISDLILDFSVFKTQVTLILLNLVSQWMGNFGGLKTIPIYKFHSPRCLETLNQHIFSSGLYDKGIDLIQRGLKCLLTIRNYPQKRIKRQVKAN